MTIHETREELLGLCVAKRSTVEAGECNFCHRMHHVVFEIRGEHPSCTLVVRMCHACVKDLRRGYNSYK